MVFLSQIRRWEETFGGDGHDYGLYCNGFPCTLIYKLKVYMSIKCSFLCAKKKKLTLLKLIDGVLAEKEEFGSIEKSTH